MVTMNLVTASGFPFHELKQCPPELLVSAPSWGSESHISVRTYLLYLLRVTAVHHIFCKINVYEVVF